MDGTNGHCFIVLVCVARTVSEAAEPWIELTSCRVCAEPGTVQDAISQDYIILEDIRPPLGALGTSPVFLGCLGAHPEPMDWEIVDRNCGGRHSHSLLNSSLETCKRI